MTGNAQIIEAFLKSKGLSPAAIAGIMGNLMEESGLSTTAYNGNEGAIGLAQWEGGRRTALQSFAAQRGGKETDLNMQLGYLWQELNSSKSGVLSQIAHSTDPASAAATWDSQFEVSSGSTRQNRINYAQSFYGGKDPSGGHVSSGAAGAIPSGSTSGSASMAPVAPTLDDYSSIDSLGSLLSSIPELKTLLGQAQSGGWSTSKFENAVEDSTWWKTHSQTARAVITEKANDPATYKQKEVTTRETLDNLARQNGWRLPSNQIVGIVNEAILTGHETDNAWITRQIGLAQNYSKLTDTGGLQGGMAGTVQQLDALAASYGVKWSPSYVARYATNILDGSTTVDTYKQDLIKYAQSAFPGLSEQLKSGATVSDLAGPYVQSMASLLEVDPSTLNVFTPSIRQALQGSTTTAGAGGARTSTPLWQFENQVRQDPRWQYTDNAKQSMATMALQLGSNWGFNG